jgi:flagellar biosynthesis protein FlhF
MNSELSRPAQPRRTPSTFAREVYEPSEPRASQSELERAISRLRMEMKSEVRALRNAALTPRTPDDLLAEIATLRETLDELVTPPKRNPLGTLLRNRGIEGRAATVLGRAARGNAGASVQERLRAALAETLTVAPWPIATKERSMIVLVGPAGVGKTTTAAKLGARVRMAKKTVAFVSCDGFRVGAADQLASYAELMGANFHEVATPEELAAVIANEGADVIILDTSGRKPEKGSVEASLGDASFRAAIDQHRNLDVILCVPAALRAAEAARIAKTFASTTPRSVCVTKLDETDAPSALVHAPIAAKLPLSILCFGQRVPEDIGPAEMADVIARIVPTKGAV